MEWYWWVLIYFLVLKGLVGLGRFLKECDEQRPGPERKVK